MKKPVISFLIGLSLLSVLLFVFDRLVLNSSEGDAKFEIEVVPRDSEVLIDGKVVRKGIVQVATGKHNISVRREGFEDQQQEVEVSAGEQKYVGIALQPNADGTANWYAENPDDAQFAEALSSRTYDQTNEDILSRYPLFRELPSFERDFTIDYGISAKDPDDPSKYALYVNADTAALRNAAVEWVRHMGFDPTDYEFYFKDLNNIFSGVE